MVPHYLKCTWVKNNPGSICRIFSLSHVLLLTHRKPYFSSAISLCETTTRPLPGGEVCVCVRKRETGAVSVWGRCLTSTYPSSAYVRLSVRGWGSCLTWCASQMTSVFTPRTVQSAKDTERTLTLTNLYFEFLGVPLYAYFFLTSKFVCVWHWYI